MNERTSILNRMYLVFGLMLLLPFGILGQMLRISLLEGNGLRELWSTQTIDFIPIPAQRGNIYDAGGSLLATNSVVYKVAVDPRVPGMQADHLKKICETLSLHTERSARHYQNKIRNAPSKSRYVVLERNVSVQAYEDLRELNIRGVILEEEYKRVYNFGSLSAHLLGFVNHNINGMTGLEAQFNDVLKGVDGRQQVRRDRSNRIFAYVGAPRKQPVQGHSLHTTIDAFIQAIAEEELEEGVKRHMAKKGTIIVLEPKTGAVKALANYPAFNPNAPATIESENRRNNAIADMIEPGSTFKLITALAAVEQNVVNFEELFETPENGRKLIHGQWMRDHNPLGTLDFKGVIAKSSNIATSEIAMRLDESVFYQYVRNMGFGTTTNIDLPNEVSGRLQKPYEWSRVTLPWMSIGYEVQATPLQIAQVYSAFANDGIMMRPYIVDRITDEYGNTIKKTRPAEVRRIAKKSTIEKLMPVFKEVVSDSGTAEWASVEGLTIAGKTGTAQKFIDGRYRTSYRASFTGFFPVEDPKYLIFVLLDEPKTSIYGGFTAGSVFKQTATRLAGLDPEIKRAITPEIMEHAPMAYVPSFNGLDYERAVSLLKKLDLPYITAGKGDMVVSQQPEAGSEIDGNFQIKLELGTVNSDSIPEGYARIPDLRGLNMRQASYILTGLGYNIQRIGSGTIYTQFPRAGDLMQKERTVTVRGKARSMEQATTLSEAK
ncbi:MAG: penicillin-binding transpeptidase domain-containing protein [Balneolaceae bacterium]